MSFRCRRATATLAWALNRNRFVRICINPMTFAILNRVASLMRFCYHILVNLFDAPIFCDQSKQRRVAFLPKNGVRPLFGCLAFDQGRIGRACESIPVGSPAYPLRRLRVHQARPVIAGRVPPTWHSGIWNIPRRIRRRCRFVSSCPSIRLLGFDVGRHCHRNDIEPQQCR